MGNYQNISDVPEHCFAYLREAEGRSVLVILSFSDEPKQFNVPSLGEGQLVLSTHLDHDGKLDLAHISLRPHEGLLIELE